MAISAMIKSPVKKTETVMDKKTGKVRKKAARQCRNCGQQPFFFG